MTPSEKSDMERFEEELQAASFFPSRRRRAKIKKAREIAAFLERENRDIWSLSIVSLLDLLEELDDA